MATETDQARKIVLEPRGRIIGALSDVMKVMAEEAGVVMMANTPELDRLTTAIIRAANEVAPAFKRLLIAGGVEIVDPRPAREREMEQRVLG